MIGGLIIKSGITPAQTDNRFYANLMASVRCNTTVINA